MSYNSLFITLRIHMYLNTFVMHLCISSVEQLECYILSILQGETGPISLILAVPGKQLLAGLHLCMLVYVIQLQQ